MWVWALVVALCVALPRESPNATGPYYVRRWEWPGESRKHDLFLSRKDFRVNATATGSGACAASSVVCMATSKNSPARLSGTHWQHAQQILLPCWSLFRRFEALRRVLVLGESVGLTSSHPWTAYVVEVMGVTVVDSLPADDPCPVVGRLGQGRASFSPFSRGSCELSRVCKAPAPPRREVPLTRVGHQDHLAVEFSRKGGSRFLL